MQNEARAFWPVVETRDVPVRRVTQARMLLGIPGFQRLWREGCGQVPEGRKQVNDAGDHVIACRCGKDVVVPVNHVGRCTDECRLWYLAGDTDVRFKDWTVCA